MPVDLKSERKMLLFYLMIEGQKEITRNGLILQFGNGKQCTSFMLQHRITIAILV